MKTTCKSKEKGGLGLRVSRSMNKALLAKWWWRFNQEKNNLWRIIVKEKYSEMDSGKLTKKPKGSEGMSVWHSIFKTLHDFKRGCKMIIRDGRRTLFWHDKWVGETSLANQFPHIFELARSKEAKLGELCTINGMAVGWDFKIRNRLSVQQ